MGEVHANDVKTGGAQLVDGLDGVGLGANSADDGGPTQVPLGGVGGVKVSEPFDLATCGEVVEGVGSLRLGSPVCRHCGGEVGVCKSGQFRVYL